MKRIYTFLIVCNIINTTFSFSQDQFNLFGTMSGAPYDSTVEYHLFNKVANVGDLNDDGFQDWAIGDDGGNYVYLYFGGTTLDTIKDMVFGPGDMPGDYGYSVCGGDVNGDSIDDLLIGAISSMVGGNWASGRVFIYFGGINIDTIPDMLLEGQEHFGLFGSSIKCNGDVNGDGWNDILVYAEERYEGRGSVYIYNGGPDLDFISDSHVLGNEDDYISSIDYVDDINDDGRDEILIGASQWMVESATMPGKAYLVYGGDSISLDNSVTFIGDTVPPYTGFGFGRRVAGLGDINADAIPDFAIGAMRYCHVYSGSTFEKILYLKSETQYESFYLIKGRYDLNNDNQNDIIITTDSLRIYFGGISLDTIPDITLLNDDALYSVGFNCAVGDFNSDNYYELLPAGGNQLGNLVYLYTQANVSVEDNPLPTLPDKIKLYQNYPNPFNGETIIKYFVLNEGNIKINIYNISGQLVSMLESRNQLRGVHHVRWNGKNVSGYSVASGVYIYQICYSSNVEKISYTKKLLLIK